MTLKAGEVFDFLNQCYTKCDTCTPLEGSRRSYSMVLDMSVFRTSVTMFGSKINR